MKCFFSIEPSEKWQEGNMLGDNGDVEFQDIKGISAIYLRRCKIDFDLKYIVVSGMKMLYGESFRCNANYEHLVVWVVTSKNQIPKKRTPR